MLVIQRAHASYPYPYSNDASHMWAIQQYTVLNLRSLLSPAVFATVPQVCKINWHWSLALNSELKCFGNNCWFSTLSPWSSAEVKPIPFKLFINELMFPLCVLRCKLVLKFLPDNFKVNGLQITIQQGVYIYKSPGNHHYSLYLINKFVLSDKHVSTLITLLVSWS